MKTILTEEFINKLDLMIAELTKFRNHLKFGSIHAPINKKIF